MAQDKEIVKNTGNSGARLPMPERLEPKSSAHSLMTSVKVYFYKLYNGADKTFRNFLASVSNKDSITDNRMFDRYKAVEMIVKAASDAKDISIMDAKEGQIYKCVSRIMRQNNMGLRLRRQEYKRLTQQPAE